MKSYANYFALVVAVVISAINTLHAQRYLADYDSTLFIRDTVRPWRNAL